MTLRDSPFLEIRIQYAEAANRRQTLRDWAHRHKKEGMEGMASRKAPGVVGKLTAAQMTELRELALAGPDPKVVRFRCVDLCEEVARRFSVAVCERTMGKWLRKLRLTRVQPRPYHLRKDAAAQEAFRKLRKPPEAGAAWLDRREFARSLVSGCRSTSSR